MMLFKQFSKRNTNYLLLRIHNVHFRQKNLHGIKATQTTLRMLNPTQLVSWRFSPATKLPLMQKVNFF